MFSVNSSGVLPNKIQIQNVAGDVVMSIKEGTVRIDVSHLTPGVYVIRYSDPAGIERFQRLVKI